MRHLLICFRPMVNPLSPRGAWRESTVFQFLEGLTDRQEAFAVRDRLAWKYALSLELTDPGFDHSVLSEFRSRLVSGKAEQRLLDLLLERCHEGGWRNRSRKATYRLNPRRSFDPLAQPHPVHCSDDGLRVEYALRGRPGLGPCPCASFLGGARCENGSIMSVCQRRSKSVSSTPIR
jgi:hypothetical protein